MKNLLLLGGDGFIGYHLTRSILKDPSFSDYSITSVDKYSNRVSEFSGEDRFTYVSLDITNSNDVVKDLISSSEIVMPLFAIATPKTYVERPMDVFQLDFEENLKIIRLVHAFGKRLVFPSTSEVYGKAEAPFNEETTDCVYGPIKNSRWIYACSKQLLDRVIFAMNKKDPFNFTLFRPFNWIGPKLDSLESSSEGSSRLITQLLDDAIQKKEIILVDGGHRKRCFTDVDDGIEGLKLILLNEQVASKRIFNIGNPWNNRSVRDAAELVIQLLEEAKLATGVTIKVRSSTDFYGAGYEDVAERVPDINAISDSLGWAPKITFEQSLRKIVDLVASEGRL